MSNYFTYFSPLIPITYSYPLFYKLGTLFVFSNKKTIAMQKIFLNLIFRRIKRNRLYTTVNVLGLSIALTATLLIYSHVIKEFKTDRFHQNGENIYRVNLSGIFSTAWSATTCDGLGPALQNDISGVTHYTRINRLQYQIKALEATDYIQPEHCFAADNQFFQMFSFPLISGSIPDETQEDWCIISEKYAHLCFDNENPTGKLLVLKPEYSASKPKEVRIAGVMKNIPDWSSIQADIILNHKHRAAVNYLWNNYNVETYVQLTPHTNPQDISSSIPELFKKYNPFFKDRKDLQGELQPLTDIYFGSSGIEFSSFWGYIPHGSRLLTLILSGVALIIFILAACNYMLIKMANLNQELSLLAVQKCYGADSRSIHMQLVTEMALQIFAALIISIASVRMLHPYFIGIMSPKQPYPLQLTFTEIGLYLLAITILTGIIGTVLYLYTQKHLTLHTIKDLTSKRSGRYDLKKTLAIVQMCIFCTLLFVSVIVLKQMHYLENKDLGLNTENTLWIQIPNSAPNTLKNEILQNPKITHISNSSAIPTESISQKKFTLPDEPENTQYCNVLLGDQDFLSTFRIPLTEGENINPESYRRNEEIKNLFYQQKYKAEEQGQTFPAEFPQLEHQILVNREFVKKYQLIQPVGTILSGNYSQYYRIVGITENFNYQPLYKNIEPVIICYNADLYNTSSFNLRYQEGSREEVLDFLHTVNEKQPTHYSSLNYNEYRYSDIYDKYVAFIRMINVFTLIALLIGGMGIFAFSVFLAENKKKEIAIRKVNGATAWKVITLLNGSFLKRTLLSCLIGLPIGYFLIQKWLENFAYKTSLEWWLFAGALFVCSIFVILIISFQTWKSATLNPVESLKRE